MSDPATLDDVDRRILALLRDNARSSYQEIGQRVSLSAPAVKRRVDRLTETGVISGFSAVVDVQRLGSSTRAIVELSTDGRFSAAEVHAAVRRHPEVVAAYTVAGPASAVLLVHATNTEHLEQVLERLRATPEVTRTETSVILSTLLERPWTGEA